MPSPQPAPFDSGAPPNKEQLGPDAYFEQGMQALDRRDPDGAIQNFSKVLEMDPENAMAYFQRGIAFQMIPDHRSAIDSFLNAQRLDFRPRAEITFHLANSYAAAGDREVALEYAAETTNLDGGNLEAWLLAGTLAFDLGHRDEARNYFKQYLERGGPVNDDLRARMAEMGL